MKLIDYSDLNRHFTYPIKRGKVYFFEYKKLPRKLKKKLKILYLEHKLYMNPCKKEEMNISLWESLWITNPNYIRFIIKHTIEK